MGPTGTGGAAAARKQLAVEIISHYEPVLRQTARRYSLCAADADDAYQRALEILLTKAPAGDARELVRWMQTVTKHEASAVRRNRERLLTSSPSGGAGGGGEDWVALIPAQADGPPEQAERREAIARSREALLALKPAELTALTLLAEGYSYAEISELTGFSLTKVNRCLAEGRERFRALLAGSQDGSRCRELRPLLSAFCDGEASARDIVVMREHLRACASCRAAMRTYKAAPGAAAALAPGLPVSQSILERLHEMLGDLYSRLPTRGGGIDSASQLATSGAAGSAPALGAGGTGIAALTKAVAVCAGAAGGAAACIATGVVPAPLNSAADTAPPPIERKVEQARVSEGTTYEPAPIAEPPQPGPPKQEKPKAEPTPDAKETGAVEYAPPAPPLEAAPAPEAVAAPPPSSGAEPSASASGSVAGEFGP